MRTPYPPYRELLATASSWRLHGGIGQHDFQGDENSEIVGSLSLTINNNRRPRYFPWAQTTETWWLERKRRMDCAVELR